MVSNYLLAVLLTRHVSVQEPGQFHCTLAKVVQLLSAFKGLFPSKRGTGLLEISVGNGKYSEEAKGVME